MPVSVSRLWRSVWLPRAAVAVALVAGLPLYLRTPLWCDLTLYDLAARNLLDGGTHYRDIFDTNLPGFVWLLTGLRLAFGFDTVVVRVADLMVVVGVVALIDRLAKWGGATPATRWWSIAGAAFLYPFAVEMVHAQRDTWMALPALGAVVLRQRRIIWRLTSSFWPSVLEGVLWGLAVWIKPHVVLMAAGVWVLTARRLAANFPHPGRGGLTDLLGNVAGGLVVGLAGVAWLVASGTWDHFWVVMCQWNPEYTKLAGQEFHLRVAQQLHWFPPWSLWLVPTVPLAVLSVIDAVPWSRRVEPGPGPVGRLLPGWLWDRDAGPDARFARAVLGGLYLVWVLQAFFIQRGFIYVHTAETLLMLGLWAAHRWAMPPLVLLWIALTSIVWLVADASPAFRERLLTVATDRHISADPGEERYIVRHPLADPKRMRWWPVCWRTHLTPAERYALWDGLRRMTDHEATTSWEELAEVADFLRRQGVQDGELIAWHDTPHVLYLMLGIRPGIRYMHTSTVSGIGWSHSRLGYHALQEAVQGATGRARFAVSDLEWTALGRSAEDRQRLLGPPNPATGDLIPEGMNPMMRELFPFNEPAVFRTRGGLGRYIVHDLTRTPPRPRPLGDTTVPPEE